MGTSASESSTSVPPPPSEKETATPVLQTPRVAPVELDESDDGAGEAPEADGPQPYDFTEQPLLGEVEKRQLVADHARFLKSLAIRLTMYLRADCQFELSGLETVSFRQFVAQLPDKTHLTLFKLENRPGICLWEVAPPLASSFTNCLMGSSGVAIQDPPPMTEVELVLVDHLVELILEEWCRTWEPDLGWRAALLGHETEKHFLRTSSPHTPFLLVNIQVHLPQAEGLMRLAFPFNTLEPLMQELSSASPSQSPPDHDAVSPDRWNPALEDIDVTVTAQLPDMQIPARQLEVGQELSLPAASIDQVRVLVSGQPRFAGRLGVRGNHWAVEVDQNSEA